MTYARIIHVYNGCLQYGGRKAGNVHGKPTAIHRLLLDISSYNRIGSQHQLDFTSVRDY